LVKYLHFRFLADLGLFDLDLLLDLYCEDGILFSEVGLKESENACPSVRVGGGTRNFAARPVVVDSRWSELSRAA
jgi:hypothetical protein